MSKSRDLGEFPAAALDIDASGNLDVTGIVTADTLISSGALDAASAFIGPAGYNIYLRNVGGTNRIDSYNDPITATVPLQLNASQHAFYIADSEKMRIDSSGNCGIGESSPSGLLHLKKASDTADIVLESSGGSGKEYLIGSRTDGSLNIYDVTASAERMRIDSAGNVGIGTTTPGNYSAVGANNLVVGTNSGSNGVTLVGAADGYASLAFADGAGTGGASDYSGLIQYSHIANSMNFFTSSSERMRIDNVGNVGIGTTSPSGTRLRVIADTGFVGYFSNSSGTGVYLASGATSWTGVSDERVKDIIEPITGAMSKLATLRTVIGKYKVDPDGTRRPFLIAQDVQAVFPEVVDIQGDEAGTLGLQYEGLIPSIIAAMKEQQTLIEALVARIEILEAK